MHLPGPDANRHLTATMDNWTMSGCVSDRPGACDKTRRVEVPMPARLEFLKIWQDVKATPRCEPGGRWPGDRAFELRWLGQIHGDTLPANEKELEARNAGPCRADARLAMWFARQLP